MKFEDCRGFKGRMRTVGAGGRARNLVTPLELACGAHRYWLDTQQFLSVIPPTCLGRLFFEMICISISRSFRTSPFVWCNFFIFFAFFYFFFDFSKSDSQRVSERSDGSKDPAARKVGSDMICLPLLTFDSPSLLRIPPLPTPSCKKKYQDILRKLEFICSNTKARNQSNTYITRPVIFTVSLRGGKVSPPPPSLGAPERAASPAFAAACPEPRLGGPIPGRHSPHGVSVGEG